MKINKQVSLITVLVALALLTICLFIMIRSDESTNDSIFINEVAFNQESNIDWIELYNSGTKSISLEGLYISDSLEDLTKYEIKKEIVLEPEAFFVIYGEGYELEEDNTIITNFRISNGETIYLTGTNGINVIDSFIGIKDDLALLNITMGRYPDGSEEVYMMSNFTPGSSNSIEEIEEEVTDYEALFDTTQVTEINLTISEDNLVVMSDYEISGGRNQTSSSTDPSYVAADLEIDGTYYEDIAIRYKGNSSLQGSTTKKPYRIDLNKYTDGQTYDGIQEFVLNPNFKDDSQIREILSYSIMRDLGFPAEYASYAKVYVNGEYIGLYTMVENIDEDFLERNFGNSDGLLVKAANNASTLQYIDDDIESYDSEFDVKLGTDSDVEDFIEFLKFLDQDVDENFEEEILKQLDVYGVMDYFAMLVTQTSMDSYLYSGRNFYIYFDTDEQKYKIIPWDMNESFGVYNGEQNNLNWDIDDPTSGEKPLFEKLYQVDSFREYYLEKVEEYNNIINRENLESVVEEFDSLVEEAENTSNPTDLLEFIEERSEEISNQLLQISQNGE